MPLQYNESTAEIHRNLKSAVAVVSDEEITVSIAPREARSSRSTRRRLDPTTLTPWRTAVVTCRRLDERNCRALAAPPRVR